MPLGLVATGPRKIRDGKQFERFFDRSQLKQTDPTLSYGDTFDTIVHMRGIVEKYHKQAEKIARHLKGKTLRETCHNIWEFCYWNIQYKEDRSGVEQLRTPIRSWVDRKEGIDCDCYSILIGCILYNLNIPFAFRKAKYDGKDYFQHIYVIVPKAGSLNKLNQRETYFVIDPVVDTNDHEVPFSEKHDMQIQMLNGLDGCACGGNPDQHTLRGLVDADSRSGMLGLEFESLGELPGVEYTPEAIYQDFLIRLKKHLHNTRMSVWRNPEMAAAYGKPSLLLQRLDYALANFDDPIQRERALTELELLESEEERLAGLRGTVQLRGFFSKIKDAVKKVGSAIGKGVSNAAKWTASTVKKGVSAAGEGISNAAKWTGSTVKKGVQAAGEGIKNAANWTATSVKKAATWVKDNVLLKYNPLFIVVRNAILLTLKINLFRMAERLGYGLWSQSTALSKGLDMGEFKKAKSKYDKALNIFEKIGGKRSSFDKNLKQGWDHGTKKHGMLRGFEGKGLGEAATAATATAAATPFIVKVTNLLKEVDWGKLLKAGESLVQQFKGEDAAASQSALQVPQGKYPEMPEPDPNAVYTDPLPADLVYNPYEPIPNVTLPGQDTGSNNNNVLLIGGGIAAAGLLILATR